MNYKEIKTNNKMNLTIKETLKMRGDNISLYALKRIEELEQLTQPKTDEANYEVSEDRIFWRR